MKWIECVASWSKRVNLGNYEHAEAFCSVKAIIESTDEVPKVLDEAYRLCQEAVSRLGPTLIEKYRPQAPLGPKLHQTEPKPAET